MRVAEHPLRQQLDMAAQLRVGVQAGAGVIEIHLPGGVEPAVLGCPQPIERVGPAIAGKGIEKLCIRRAPLECAVHISLSPPLCPGSGRV
jgi:hypothetical protein